MIRAAALIAILLAAGAVCAGDPEAAARHWRLAQDYLAKGLRAHAVAEAKVVLRLAPGHGGARALVDSGGLAPVQPAAPVPAATETVTGTAATSVPGSPATLEAEAIRAYRESRVEDARRLANEVLAADPANAEAQRILGNLDQEEYRPTPLGANAVLRDLFEKGIGLYRAGAWDEAAGMFQQGLAVSPSHEQSQEFFNRCRARAEDVKVERSLAAARTALAAGRTAEAKAALQNVLAIRPEHAEAKSLLEGLGAGPQAEERKRQAKEHFNRGVEAYERGQWGDAIREWEIVTALDSSDTEAKKLLRKARGKQSAARKTARQRVPAMHEEAQRLYQQGKLEDAGRKYREILELDPADEKAKRGLELIEGQTKP